MITSKESLSGAILGGISNADLLFSPLRIDLIWEFPARMVILAIGMFIGAGSWKIADYWFDNSPIANKIKKFIKGKEHGE